MGDLDDITEGRVDDPRQADFLGVLGPESPAPKPNGHDVPRTNGHHKPSTGFSSEIQVITPRPQAYADPEPPEDEPMLADFQRTAKGAIKPLFTNVVHLLRTEPRKWQLQFDEFAHRAVCRGRYLEDHHMREIAEWVQNQGIPAGLQTVQDAVLRAAERHRTHPIRDYLRSLKWDQTPRLDHFLIDHAGAHDDSAGLTRAFCRRWMIQAVARVMEPGCHARAMLILEGRQDIGKSTILRELFGRRYFTDHLPDIQNKDAILQLRGAWCIEVAELASLGKQDAARIKAFLTARDDKMRDPYGRTTSDIPRQTVFAGTVNPGAGGYLKDETGGTRFWPVKLSGTVDLASITANRSQLWAEAFARYAAGELWWFDSGEDAPLIKAAAETQAERFEGDAWEEKIAEHVHGRSKVSVQEIFTDVLRLTEPADWDQQKRNRIGKCLTHLGWERRQRKVDGKPKWFYFPPDSVE